MLLCYIPVSKLQWYTHALGLYYKADHHSCSAVCYVVLIKITLNTIVDAWKYNTGMHVTP